MSAEAAAVATSIGGARRRMADYFALTKPRVVSMVLVTTFIGYYLGAAGAMDPLLALNLLIGTALAAGGTLALNQYFERDLDGRMERTRRRPLPAARLRPIEGLMFGLLTAGVGFVCLIVAVNWMSAAVIAAITLLYLGAYTPLKRVSWACNIIGAVPGALPPVAGWLAARSSLGAEPILLFAIMYFWQLPHTLAIARLYRRDYEAAGIHLCPPDGPRGLFINSLIVTDCLMLMAASLMPALMGYAGRIYLAVAIALGLGMLACGYGLILTPDRAAATRRVIMASLVYLPLVLVVLVLDRI
ncbi:MAG TPA: heme o synthase [Candidatus Binataceae bacterium]|nr:heme o synthase [Candidatus Binataceae bacterium]